MEGTALTAVWIGQCWNAAFAFWIIGTVFFVWIMVMASQVNQNQYG